MKVVSREKSVLALPNLEAPFVDVVPSEVNLANERARSLLHVLTVQCFKGIDS